jgi:hypothetical protein
LKQGEMREETRMQTDRGRQTTKFMPPFGVSINVNLRMMQRGVVAEFYSSGLVVPFSFCPSGNRLITVWTGDEITLCPAYILPVFTD